MLNFSQVAELLEAIDRMNVLFIGDQLGTSVLTRSDKHLLGQFGIDWKTKYTPAGKIDEMFRFGLLAEALGQDAVRFMTYPQFKKHLASGKFLSATEAEKSALQAVKFQAYNDIKGLGNRVSNDFSQVFIEVDRTMRAAYERVIETEAARAVAQRETAKELASRLGRKTSDWARDFDRIADYIMHNALDHGISQQVLKTHGNGAKVYKDVYNGACSHCQRLFLTGGIGSVPKVFLLQELLNNGSNIGRKTADWKPTIGPTHPYCRCTLHFKPDDVEWDDKTKDFSKIVRDTKGIRRTSQPKISIEF